MTHEILTNKILLSIGKKSTDIAKKKYGKLPELSYYELINRIIIGKTSSMEVVFPEWNKNTTSKFLEKLFNKPKRKPWYNYFLSLISYKYCSSCKEAHPTSEFSNNSSTDDGLQANCNSCRSTLNSGYYNNNKSSFIHKNNLRRANKLQATPIWANLDKIKDIYDNCPEGFHVDHVIPLNNDLVCGLHCELNLMPIPAKENLSKSNKFDPESYIHILP